MLQRYAVKRGGEEEKISNDETRNAMLKKTPLPVVDLDPRTAWKI